MLKLAVCLGMTGIALPGFAGQRVTVEQLERALAAAQGKPDAEVARQLSAMELTERLSFARFERLKADLSGEKAQQALLTLADTSAFLDPPAVEIPATATPDAAAQRRMMAMTVNYVGKTLPLLPNLFATRHTTRFENRPSQSEASLLSENPLREVGTSTVTVLYRDNQEFVDSGAAKDKKPQVPDKGLTSWGEFGPILGTTLIDAARSKLSWSHWELSPNGPEAVFHYSVPIEKSHYDVRFCCVSESYGLEINVVRQRAGYHGEIAVDPSSGTILRLTVEADLAPGNPIGRASILVEYGPVEIGGRTYFCPVRSIALAQAPDLRALHDMLFPSTTAGDGGNLPSLKKTSLTSIAQVPQQTLLNDVAFRHYHLFRAETRMVAETKPGVVDKGSAGAVVQSTPEDTPVPGENARPAAEVAMESSNPASGAPAPTAEVASASMAPPGPAPAPEPELPEISVSDAAGLPASPALAQSNSPDAGVTLRVNARLVDVGVVALDKKGRPVTNLKPEDFEIYDNGSKQNVRSFGQASTTTANENPAQPASATDQAAFSNRRVTIVKTAPEAQGNTTILLIDNNLSFGDLGNAREQMLKFLRTVRDNERVALYVMKVGGFRVLEEGTTDHDLLADKLAKFRASAQDISRGEEQEDRNRQKLEYVHSPEDLLSVNGNNLILDPQAQTEALDPKLRDLGDNPGRDALSILVDVARHLGSLPGHKSLVWVASDNVLADWNQMSLSINKGSKYIEASALRAQEAMNDAHVSVYPLDASRLEAGVIDASIGTRNVQLTPTYQRPQAAEAAVEGPEATSGSDLTAGEIADGNARDIRSTRLTAQMRQDLNPIQGAFREVADATGGRTFRRSNDILSELNGVVADGRATYLLGFTPSQPADGAYHLLTVKLVGHRDVTLRYRTGYVYKKEASAIKDRFREAVWQPADVSDIAVTATPAAGKDTLKLNIAANDLAVAQTGDLWTDKVDIFLVQRDDTGLHAQVTGQTMNLRLKPATYQKYLQEGIPFDQLVGVRPATGSVRILVVDENSGRMGSITLPAAVVAENH
jgi:VWFA-related protein